MQFFVKFFLAIALVFSFPLFAAQVAKPVFSAATSKTYVESVTVKITSSTANAKIYYTLDGTSPSNKVGTLYRSALNLERNVTVKAIALKDGLSASSIASAVYKVAPKPPVLTDPSQAFLDALNVSATPKTLFSVVRYTLDGAEPTTSSPAMSVLGVKLKETRTLKVKAFKNGMTPSDTVIGFYPRATVLLIHGLNSNADVWQDLVAKELFVGESQSTWQKNCPVVDAGSTPAPVASCYRAQFGSTLSNGVRWNNGDGVSFLGLRAEMEKIVAKIVNATKTPILILAGHSRGGLAARTYLQGSTASRVRFGLVTIGTPHQGSPFGRIDPFYKARLTADELKTWQQKESDLRFVFAPSTASLATEHDSNQKPVKNGVAKDIATLNENVAKLASSTTAFGQIIGTNYSLGQDSGPWRVNLLGDLGLKEIAKRELLPGPFDPVLKEMRSYILLNLPSDWKDTDGIVPKVSADLSKVAGVKFSVETKFASGLRHIDQTSQVGTIRNMLKTVVTAINGKVTWASATTPPEVAVESRPSTANSSDEDLFAAWREAFAIEDSAQLMSIEEALASRIVDPRSPMRGRLRAQVNLAPPDEAAALVPLLARAASAEAIRDLVALTVDQNLPVRWAAMAELRAIGPRVAPEEQDEATVVLENAFRSAHQKGDRDLYEVIATAIAGIGRRSGIATLFDVLDDAEIREATRTLRNEEAIEFLAEELRHGRLIAGDVLAQMVSPVATTALVNWASTTDDVDHVRNWLGGIGDRQSLEVLQEAAVNETFVDARVRRALIDVAMERARDFRVERTLQK